MRIWLSLLVLVLLVGTVGALYAAGMLPHAAAEAIDRTIKQGREHAAKLGASDKAPAPATRIDITPRVSVVTMRRMPITERVIVTGTIVPRREIIIAPELNGLRVRDVRVDAGDRVTQDQVLATLVTDGLDARLAQADAAIARAEAAIAKADREIARATLERDQARRDFERARTLTRRNVISDSVLEQRNTAARTADARLASAKADRTAAEADKRDAIAKRRELVWQRQNAELRAPAAGLILERTIKVGELALQTGTRMFRIAKDAAFELEAEVVEADLARLKSGLRATVELAGGRVVTGQLRLVMPQIDPETRLGRVRIDLGQSDQVRAGAFARAAVILGRTTQIAVPRASVMYDASGPFVLTVDDGTVVARPVQLGITNGDLYAVTSGLNHGDRVIAKSGTFLRPGDRVIAVDAPPIKLSETR